MIVRDCAYLPVPIQARYPAFVSSRGSSTPQLGAPDPGVSSSARARARYWGSALRRRVDEDALVKGAVVVVDLAAEDEGLLDAAHRV